MRLAHLTDLHLLSLEGSHFRDFVNKRWTGGVNLLLNRGRHHLVEVFDALIEDLNASGIDQVVCTGDVSNLSLESEFLFARARFDKIAAGAGNVLCVPGNHDNYIAEVAGLFEKVFAPYCSADAGWSWPSESRWPIVRVRGDLALIGLSTSQASGWFMGYGTVGKEQLERLEQVLADPRLAGKFRVIVMHHPSAGKKAKSLRRGLHDHKEFAEVIARAGVELIVHGHEHIDLRETLSGPQGEVIPVLGVQSSTYSVDSEKRRARYRVFDIAARESGRPVLRSHALRTWRPKTRLFEAEVAA